MLVVLLAAATPVFAADDTTVERMVTCKDSWCDGQKSDPAELKPLGTHLHAVLQENGNDPFLVPKARLSIAGLNVKQVYPNSLGMGVGFSVLVDATFDQARHAIEKSLGKPLSKCEVSDDMRTCGLEITDKRTVMMMAPDNQKGAGTLVGCYYF